MRRSNYCLSALNKTILDDTRSITYLAIARLLPNILPWLFRLLQIFDPKLQLVNQHGVCVRISNVNVRISDVRVRISDVRGHTSDVYFRIHRDDVRIHDRGTHHHDRAEVAAVHGLLGECEYLE